MDSENTKQIVIAFHAIEDACDAILKPARTELNDTETVAKMSKVQYDTLEYIKTDCGAIQKVLSRMADYVGDMEESIHNNGDIETANKMIRDILFDIPPIPNKKPKTSLADHMVANAIGAAKRTERALF